MRTLRKATMMIAFAVVGVSCAAKPSPALEPGGRTVLFHPGRQLRDLLLPSDRVVTFVRDDDITMIYRRGESSKQSFRRAMSTAAAPPTAMAVVLVTSVEASLTEDGTWVETRLKLRANEVLEATPTGNGLAVGEEIDAELGGGVTMVGAVVVRATPAVTFTANQRYLLALAEPTLAGRRNLVSDLAFSIDQRDRLSPIHASASALSGLTLQDARELLHARR